MKLLAAIVICGSMLAGCASVGVSESVVLVTIDVSRSDNSAHVLKPGALRVDTAFAGDGTQAFRIYEEQYFRENGHTIYMARMSLPPGRYRLSTIAGNSIAFPFAGGFEVPVLGEFEVKPHTVNYLGRVSAALRLRREGEFAAGPLAPFIDQQLARLPFSTWDVENSVPAERDLPKLLTLFPDLADTPIDTVPLPAWRRAAAQAWWENGTPRGLERRTGQR